MWNVNMGGHFPRLELRPVTYDQITDIDLMYKYHKDWAYELGLNMNQNAEYEI